MEHITKSDSIKELSAALAKAQGQMEGAAKDRANPFFKSNYATLASVMEACRKPLSDNGLAVMQLPQTSEAGITLTTMLMHSSGEWMSSSLSMAPVKSDPQGIGSCITYARRYALASVVGVCPEDDDGEAASLAKGPQKASKREPNPSEQGGEPESGPTLSRAAHLEAVFKKHGIRVEDAIAWGGQQGFASLTEFPDKTVANIEKYPAKFKETVEGGAK